MTSSFFLFLSVLSVDFLETGEGELRWQIVNDTVMGGRSSAKVENLDGGGIKFTGKVSLENNGGFASFRSRGNPVELRENGTFKMKVKGDGRSYTMDLRTGMMRGAFSWKMGFDTVEDEVLEIELPLSEFYPTSFGKRLPALTRLSPSSVKSVGFMLYDGKEGPFDLKILELEYVQQERALPSGALGLIDLAITRGVPLYNRGEPEACAAIYETALKSLLLMPEMTSSKLGFDLADEISMGDKVKEHDERAWAYRRTLDRVLAQISRT